MEIAPGARTDSDTVTLNVTPVNDAPQGTDAIVVIPEDTAYAFGLADFGRVWLEGEQSDEWHPSYGGGIAFEVAGAPMTFWTGAAKAREEDGARFYFLSGFGF